jgi:hypothetical protein
MATFTFDEANNTTLEDIDSKWAGDTTGLITTDGKLRATAAYQQRAAMYENSQGNYQSSRGYFKAIAYTAGQELFSVAVHKTGVIGTGYEARCSSAGGIALYRSGSYVSEDIAVTFGSDFDIEITTTDAGGGSVYVRCYVGGVQKISYTDSSPLTTGSPGFNMYSGDNGVTALEMYTWTDGVSSASIVPRLMLLGVG